MRDTQPYKDKKITVVGLARSGVACANLLYELGAQVNVTDNKDDSLRLENSRKLKSKNIKVELGRHTPDSIKGSDLVVISPGVTSQALPVVLADERNIPVISEIELAFSLCPATVVAVTGSIGKTTVTSLIANIINASGKKAFACGNIGTPFCAQVTRMQEADFAVVEVSSFQLERIKDFKPAIACMLNFSRNHLDRHADMQEYLEAKKRIYANMDKGDYLVLNYDDPVLRGLSKETKAKVVYFSKKDGLNPNQGAALAVGGILGIDRGIIEGVFGEFRGLEHRMEFVAEINGVRFINDSKATTMESAAWALENIATPVILIAGGKDKGVDYASLLGIAKKKVRGVILIGEAREKMESAWKGSLSMEGAGTMEEAVRKAFLKAGAKDTVLLSPMCSSFDMFSDYEERGRVFKRCVLGLTAKGVKA